MQKIMASICLSFLIFGCANRSGVFRVDDNTFQTSTRATWELGGRAGAKRMALEDATGHCAAQGRVVRVIQSTENYGHFEGGTVDMLFACDEAKK